MKGWIRALGAAGLALAAWCGSAQGSIGGPGAPSARWSTSVEAAAEDTYDVTFRMEVAEGLYSYDLESDAPSTLFEFEPQGLELVGPIRLVTSSERVYDEGLAAEVGHITGEVRFVQRVRTTRPLGTLRGEVVWHACEGKRCFSPEEWAFEVQVGAGAEAVAVAPLSAAEDAAPVRADAPRPDSGATPRAGGSLWGLVIEAILWGFAALLTPCVFPMVPMTVSFFLKGSRSASAGRMRALLYGLFIVGLFTVPIGAIILITRIAGGEAVTVDIFNWLATHWLPNVLFFIVFMIFAASFFGAFEIRMPSRLVNRSDQHADRGGVGGIFFMALTLVLVSFSCTGPIVSSVLIKSTSGEFWAPIVTMFAFSLAFSLPFTLFALFPSMLQNLPRSGGWLNSVKVVLGFIEVALGFKFLSVADQTYHWGLLDREVYLAIWIVVFSLLGLYLLGKLRFRYDDAVERISVKRLTLSIVVFTFVVYMIPGMWGAPLKALSGYLPPLHSQDFVLGQRSLPDAPVGNGGGDGPTSIVVGTSPQQRKYADLVHLPPGIDGWFDLDEGMEAARRLDRPVLVDFTGAACTNCREMEAKVWSDQRVRTLLNRDYVLVALTGDDRSRLPEEEWVTTATGKQLRTLGKVNTYLLNSRYGVIAMPTYLVLGHDGQLLLPPRGYDLSVDGYVDFLERGLAAYRKSKER